MMKPATPVSPTLTLTQRVRERTNRCASFTLYEASKK